ncbi:MAG: 2OG-Fe(II) oxygenase [Sphingobacteriales bacterium]|nr:MAG: 2OG-Fe(II) oxygenase [Sphingobacteriales bacterium]
MKIFRWQQGRQGSGYEKALIATAPFPVPFDCYLLRYSTGAFVPRHVDQVQQGERHFRLNIVLNKKFVGGDFQHEGKPIYESKRIKIFRPDLLPHWVTPVKVGTRYVLSIGWILRD